MSTDREQIRSDDRAVALYHVVYRHEGFEVAAQMLFQLIQLAQQRATGKPRKLFLDIEGHRDSNGRFDADMTELQEAFLLRFLNRFVSEIHCPLAGVTNPNAQDDDIPLALLVRDERPGQGPATLS